MSDPVNEEREPGRPTAMRFAGAGVELAGACLVGALIGHAADRYLWPGADSWGLLAGGLLGFAAGMANLVWLAMKYNR